MPPPYRPYISQTVSELIDLLGMMMLRSPTFLDKTGYFPQRNICTVFSQLNRSLQVLSGILGEDHCRQLRGMSDRMRIYFDADQNERTENTMRGRELIDQMEEILMRVVR